MNTQKNNLFAHGHDLSQYGNFSDVCAALQIPDVRKTRIQVVGGREFSAREAIVNAATGAPLGVVGKNYQLVQPREMLRPVFRACAESQNGPDHLRIRPLRAGVEGDGEYVWASFSVGVPRPVGPARVGDLVSARLIVRIDNTGIGASCATLLAERLWCANGCHSPRTDARVRIAHRGDTDQSLRDFCRVVGSLAEGWDATVDLWSTMTRARVHARRESRAELYRTYAARVFGPSEIKAQLTTDDGITRRVRALMDAADHGAGSSAETADGTAWGLWQALTDYQSHGRKMSDARFRSLTGGTGAEQNRRGMDAAMVLAQAAPGIPLSEVFGEESEILRNSANREEVH